MSGHVGIVGHQPTVSIRPIERLIYEALWRHDAYRAHSPGEQCAREFLAVAKPHKGASLLDLGCGTGRGGMTIAMLAEMNVTFIDFAANALDPNSSMARLLPAARQPDHASPRSGL